ncbi:conjugative transposon protein TraK [Algoriphagus pacificus]|uniref:Conjugative transposon protein TraK n=1 Tax=Algoriphagus pacificus TaxID=2811234 RepID=A0ABS3CK87_9BACT|nr:conjugative transposon protein TraK [Algoriphagus pacificus]MBN7816896.1 conjugative transposon protein TraK [Algoriphagus pacificus]
MKRTMIKQLTQLDTAFQLVKWWSLGIVCACLIAVFGTLYYSMISLEKGRKEIYLLNENQLLKASSTIRGEMASVESRAHIKQLHDLLFTYSPDEKLIQEQLEEAFYLGDGSIKFHVDNLRESGYYKQVLAANISQRLVVDSIRVDLEKEGFPFLFYGRQEIIRSSSKITRSLITQGKLREVQRSHHNPHGFLVENWEILENRDLNHSSR